jgi:hypothetical protein
MKMTCTTQNKSIFYHFHILDLDKDIEDIDDFDC